MTRSFAILPLVPVRNASNGGLGGQGRGANWILVKVAIEEVQKRLSQLDLLN